jgi:hypothetical protein
MSDNFINNYSSKTMSRVGVEAKVLQKLKKFAKNLEMIHPHPLAFPIF